jgi:HK97 family phage major capsid protein
MTEMKQDFEDLNKAFAAFKENNDQALAELKKGMPDPLQIEKVGRIEADLSDLSSKHDEAIRRLKAAEIRANRPQNGGAALNEEQLEAKTAHASAFESYMRNPGDNEAKNALRVAERTAIEKKAVATTTNGAGGYAVPEEISTTIHEKLLDVSPMRQVARVVTAGTPDYKELVDVLGDSYAWVGETGSRSETDTPSLEEVAPSFGTIYAYPFATEESLNDMFFDVAAWLQRRSIRSFAKGEGIAFISGDGSNKPTGFLNGTPEATADDGVSPARSFGTLEYKPTGNATGFGAFSNTSPEFYPADVFIDTVYALKAGYRQNAVWTANKATLGQVRRFKNADGDYIWQPGMQAGMPATIHNYAVVEAEDMPDVGANAFPVAFGDFQEGYLIVDLVGLRITVDDNITAPGYIKYYIRKRVGGKLLNDDAIKVIKCAAS